MKSKAAIDRLRCPITRRCSHMLRASPSTSFRFGRWRNPFWTSAISDRTYVFGKWDTGFSNYTHLKESLDEKLKFNEGWWFHDLRRTGKPR